MRSNVAEFEMLGMRSLDDALSRLSAEPGVWRPFAGGTDLMVLFEAGQLAHRKFLNLWGLPELGGITETANEVSIGALATYSEISAHQTLAREFPMLGMAARETGAVAIQNRGTLGGNIANASPAADSPPALLAYDAELELVSKAGKRRVAYADFHTGYKKTVMKPDELIYRIHLPRPSAAGAKGLIQEYRKVGTRKAQAISKVCFAATLHPDGHARIALGSIAATPVRCKKAEAALSGQKLSPAVIARARAALEAEITPIDDIRSTAEYRKRVAGALLERFLTHALENREIRDKRGLPQGKH